jgi:cellulose synthase operon protein C
MRASHTPVVLLSAGLLWLSACAGPGAVRRDELSPEAQTEAARLRAAAVARLLGPGDPSPALPELEAALALAPGDVEARLWAAWTAELLGEDGRAFDHLLVALEFPHPALEMILWEAYWLAGTRAQMQALSERLEALAAEPAAPWAVRARAAQHLGLCLRSLGHFKRAEAAFAQLGLVRAWQVAGPFDNDQNAGFETAFPPERGLASLSERYPGKLREVGWREVHHLDFDGRVNLGALLDPARWSTAYLVTWVRAETAREVALRLAAHRGVKLWLNDRLLLADDEAHSPALDQHVVGARLRPGWNKLLVKVCQRTGAWQLRLRLTEPDGRPAGGLEYSAELHPTDPEPRAEPAPAVDGGLAAWLEAQPAGPFRDALRVHWTWRLGFQRQASALAAAFALAHPESAFAQLLWAHVDQTDERTGSALRALAEAERLAPGLPDAVLTRVRHEQAQRRLERAMRLLEPLRAARPQLRSAALQRLTLLTGRGFSLDALRETRAALALEPDRAWLWRLLGDQQAALEQPLEARRAYRRALELQADHQATYDRLIELALEAGDFSEALALARRNARVFPTAVVKALKQAQVLLAAGDPSGALEVCARVERIAPEYWLLHRLRGDALYRLDRREEALRAYRLTLELEPNNPGLREYLDFVDGRPDPVLESYELEEAYVEGLLQRTQEYAAAFPEADVVFLLDDEITHVFADGSSKHRVRQIHLVRTENGRRAFDHFRVPDTPSFRLDVAEVVQPDGSRQEATAIERGVIHFPSLQPGSVLHVAYRYARSSSSWMEDHYDESFAFQGANPVQHARWVLALPADKPLTVLKRGRDIREDRESLGAEQVWIWRAAHVPMLRSEPNMPAARELAQAVYVSTVPSWEALARWQNSLIQDQFDVSAAIREKTRELVAGAATPQEKLEAIYAFVAREVRYLDNDAGIFGKKPNKAVDVFDNRFGDCKDKATLMIAMLREVGIQAAYAGVRTRDRGPVFWEIPSAQTNHIITYLPAQPGFPEPLFVDGTSRFGHLRYLPERDQGVKALVLDGHSHQVVETPLLGPETSVEDVRLRAQLHLEELWLRGEERWTGLWSYARRERLQNPGKRAEEFARQLNYRYRGARVDVATFEGLDDLGPEVRAFYGLHVPGKVRAEGDSLRLQPLWPLNAAMLLAPRPERYNDIEIQVPWVQRVELTLQLPPGRSVRSLPAPARVETPLFDYERSCQAEAGQVRCTRSLRVRAGRQPRAAYEEFRRQAVLVDQAEEQDLVLGPAQAP